MLPSPSTSYSCLAILPARVRFWLCHITENTRINPPSATDVSDRSVCAEQNILKV